MLYGRASLMNKNVTFLAKFYVQCRCAFKQENVESVKRVANVQAVIEIISFLSENEFLI